MSEKEIQRLLDQYGLNRSKIFGDTILINSQFDEWLIEIKFRISVLKHQSTKRNKTMKFKAHIQRTFGIWELDKALEHIKQHDVYTLNYKHSVPSIMRKFEEINAFA